MKRTNRFYNSFVSAAVIFTALSCLSACGNTVPEATETAEATTEATPVLPAVDLSADSGAAYTVVRPENVSDTVLTAFKTVRQAVIDAGGQSLNVSDDWLKSGTEPGEYEILIGATNRPESAQVLENIGNNEYIIAVCGKKLVINAGNDDLISDAVNRFVALVSESKQLTFDAGFSLTGSRDYRISSLTVNKKDISEYQIIYSASSKSSAEALAQKISEACAVSPAVTLEKNAAEGSPKIYVGLKSYENANGTDSADISFKGENICINAGGSRALTQAVNVFAAKYLSGTGEVDITAADGETLWSVSMPSREELLKNPGLMPVHWEGLYDPDPTMLDYQKKLDVLYTRDKSRIFTVSHRGDFLYYPENSLESLISVWKMGGDCVEIDIQYTSDGVAVLMHDATLTRMTNYSSLAGKNGLPNSADISDWTYEQLQQLNLKDGEGGNSAQVTAYKIATLEEALTVSKGRFFLILDKASQWRYCEIDGIQSAAEKHYILPLMQKTGNVESVLISYGHMTDHPFTADMALRVQKYIYGETGQKMLFYLRGWTSGNTADEYAEYISKCSLTNSAILVNGAINPTSASWKSAIKTLIKKYPDTMFGGWTIDDTGYDCEKYWEIIYDAGIRSIMTNDMFSLVRYAATKAN